MKNIINPSYCQKCGVFGEHHSYMLDKNWEGLCNDCAFRAHWRDVGDLCDQLTKEAQETVQQRKHKRQSNNRRSKMKNLMEKIICSYFENNCTVDLTPVQIIDVVEEEMQGRYPHITFAACGWYFKFSEDKWGASYSVSLIDKDFQEYARCCLTTDDDYQNGHTLKFEVLDKPNCLKPESLEDIVYGIIPRIGQAVEFLRDEKWSLNN